MKRNLKSIMAAILAAAMLFCLTGTASAERAPLWIGDVDFDGGVTILDATWIQRSLVGLYKMTKRGAFAADTNAKGYYDITDATRIQRKLAGFENEFYTDGVSNLWANVVNFYADYASGKAMVGVPVTFTIVGEGKNPTFVFRVDGEIVQERSEKSTMTYTFNDPGGHSVTAIVYNDFDEYATYSMEFFVVGSYKIDGPTVTNVYGDHVVNNGSDHTVTVCATGGAAPYRYRYVLKGNFGEYAKEDPEWKYDKAADAYVREYSDDAAVTLPRWRSMIMIDREEYRLYVMVMDAEGQESEPYLKQFFNEDIPG